jgi:hypothetical protein
VPNGGQFYKRWFASTGVLLIKAPLLSLFVPQRIRVCTERPRQKSPVFRWLRRRRCAPRIRQFDVVSKMRQSARHRDTYDDVIASSWILWAERPDEHLAGRRGDDGGNDMPDEYTHVDRDDGGFGTFVSGLLTGAAVGVGLGMSTGPRVGTGSGLCGRSGRRRSVLAVITADRPGHVRAPGALAAALASALLVTAAGLSAQTVPGAPKGDWLAYSVLTSPDTLQRCAVPPVVYAEWRKTVDAVAAVVSTSPGLADLTGYCPRLSAGADSYATPAGVIDSSRKASRAHVPSWR